MQMNQPVYPNYNPAMQNPYIDRMNQLQQYQQNLQMQPTQMSGALQAQPPGLVGRAVNDFSEIKADDVPMNGTPAIFIKSDMSEIEVRVWCKDGLIRPTSYKPVVASENSQATNTSGGTAEQGIGLSNELIGAFMGRFDDIVGRIEGLEKSMANLGLNQSNTRTNLKTKKETEGNERGKQG